jgi:hypothetical protein
MVLQRDKPNTFWGWTTPGEKVQVEIAGKKATGRAEADGRWAVRIKPPAVGGPYTVTIRGHETIELTDVLVGDVWICSGQSNMEMGLTAVDHGPEDAAAANDPQMRLFMTERQVGFVPQRTNEGQWKVCTPETVAQGGWGGFSAVGYHFGKELRERLNVPLIVDAGLGLPSHACQVMEWGYDAVLLNTAVALAQDPVAMAGAFADAVQAGHSAFLAGAMQAQDTAQPSTPVLGTPFWHHA